MKRAAYLIAHYETEPSQFGRAGRYVRNLATAVAARGDYEVEIIASAVGAAGEVKPLAPGVSLRLLPAADWGSGREAMSWELGGALRGADVVHVHEVFSRPSEVAVIVAKLFEKPVCVTDHGRGTSQLGRSLGILDVADRVIAYSDFGRSLLPTRGSVATVRGGVDDEFFTPPPARGGREGLLFVGELSARKGIERLIAALPGRVGLTICGRASDPDYYNLLRQAASGKAIRFVLDASDAELRELYRRALAVVVPSVQIDCNGVAHAAPELIGFAALEGMACGAPAICARIGSLPEQVRHGEDGFIFDTDSELSTAIERVVGDPARAEAMGAAARARVVSELGLEPAGRAMSSVYDELLDGRQ